MTALLIHREKAIKYARVAQATSGALVLAAGAIMVLGLPWAGAGQPITAELPAPFTDTGAAVNDRPPVSEGVDFTGLSTRLAMIDNAPKRVEVAVDPTAPRTDQPTPPTETQPVRFLGAIIEPTQRVALLHVNGRQRAVTPGQTIRLTADEKGPTVKVISVEDDSITIEDSTGQHKVEKSARAAGSIISKVDVAGTVPMTPPQPQDSNGMDPSMRAMRDTIRNANPEDRRRLIDEARRSAENRFRRGDRPNQGNE